MVPKLELKGLYKATGKFLGSDVKGDGEYKILIEDVIGNIKFKPSITKVENGKTFMRVNKIKILLDPKRWVFYFTNSLKIFDKNINISERVCILRTCSMEMK